MYTECPHCQTCFRISEDHLRIASGKVRCGSCQEVFDATQHLFKNLTDREPITDFQIKPSPVPPPPPPAAPKAPAAPASRPAVTKDIDLSTPTPPDSPNRILDDIRRERANAPDQQHFMESTIGNDRYNNLDEIGKISIPGEIDFGDSLNQFPDEQKKLAPEEEVKPAAASNGTSAERTPYEDIDSMETAATDADHNSIKDFYAQVDAQLHETSDKSQADDRSQLDKDIDELLEFAKGLDVEKSLADQNPPHIEPNPQTSANIDDRNNELEDEFDFQAMADFEKEMESSSETSTDDEGATSDFASADELAPDEKLEEPASTEPFAEHDEELQIASDLQDGHAKQDETEQTDEDIPRALRQSLDMLDQRPRRSLGMSLLLGLVIIVLIGGLGFQVILFRNVELVHAFPQLTPILNKVCDQLPCRYSGKVDVSQIKLLNRDVRSDPKQANALLISATFVDQAPFDQPYPNILITLYDLGGNVVASRRFTPREYLESMYNRFLLMESGTPVHVTLAVLDPGKDAINFEFSFQ